MKRFLILFFLLTGLTAAAQSPRYTQFKEYRNQADTLRMKQMLDDWGEKDPEFYAAWTNYCSVMADETEDPTWLEMAVNWANLGREEFPDDELLLHKQGEVFFDTEQFGKALPVLQDIEKRGIGDVFSWYQLSVLYGAKGDLAQSRRYLEKMIQEGDEEDRNYAQEVLASYDDLEHLADSLALHPDHAAIKELAQTPAFQELTDRFAACDTTLTREEIASLYYGSSYLKDYNSVPSQCDDIKKMAEEGKIEDAKTALEAKLKDYPVSLFLLFSRFNLAEDEAEAAPYRWKIVHLLAVIDNTGKLYDTEHPFQVICVNDEYHALNHVLGMEEFQSQAVVDGPLDKMDFLNEYGLEMTAYFYLTPPYWERLNSLFGGNK